MNTEHDWTVWWNNEGSGMRPLNGQDHESHVRDMTRIAWLNGAFGAAAEIERLREEAERFRAERDEARRMLCEDWAKQDGLPLDWQGRRGAEGMAEFVKWDCFKENNND